MSLSIPPLENRIKAITGVVVAAGALVPAIRAISDFAKGDNGLPLFIAAAILLFVGIAWAREGFQRPSRLVIPTRFANGLDDPAFRLHGREGDIASLLRLIAEARVVHLVGESGVGKSTLLRYGLVPRAQADKYIPIIVDRYGEDWSTGPAISLLQGLRAARNTSGIGDFSESNADIVKELRTELDAHQGRLLLIFDNIDEYISLHAARFRATGTGAWIRREELISSNPFWKFVSTLVEAGKTGCVFAADTAADNSLSPVRFGRPEVYTLGRLPIAVAAQIIEDISAPIAPSAPGENPRPVITAPERGWEALKERLLKDLSFRGAILPADLRTCLTSLTFLSEITVGAYERAGGLDGVKAHWFRALCNDIANTTGVTEEQVIEIVRTIRGDPSRRVSMSSSRDILNGLNEYNSERGLPPVSEVTIDSVLQSLESGHIILRVGQNGDSRWTLYFEHLRAVVDAAVMHHSPASRLLEMRQGQYERARNSFQRWSALLTIPDQSRLLWARLTRKIRYGRYKRFALLSLLRLTPGLLLVAAYVLVCDSGRDLPGGAFVREQIDSVGASLLRRPKSCPELRAALVAARGRLLADLRSRLTPSGWVSDARDGTAQDAWAHCQALAAAYRADFPASVDIFMPDPLMSSIKRINGLEYGWRRATGDFVVSMPAMWCAEAFSRATTSLTQPKDKARFREFLKRTLEMALRYQRLKIRGVNGDVPVEGAWDMMALQATDTPTSNYSAVLALQMLLEARRASYWIDGNDVERDRLLAKTHERLIAQSGTTSQGFQNWMAANVKGEDFSEGLTLQAFAVLLRAEEEARLPLPPGMFDEIARHIVSLAEGRFPVEAASQARISVTVADPLEARATELFNQIGSDAEVAQALQRIGVDSPGKLTNYLRDVAAPSSNIMQRTDVTFLWHPWAIEAGARWLAAAEKRNAPRRQRRSVARALSQLLEDTDHVMRAKDGLTFRVSEMLYAVAGAESALTCSP
jgi:hypothetical protein